MAIDLDLIPGVPFPVLIRDFRERINNEIRRRIKIIDSLPAAESAMKIIYPKVTEINEAWSQRMLRGFYKCMDRIMEMFRKWYA